MSAKLLPASVAQIWSTTSKQMVQVTRRCDSLPNVILMQYGTCTALRWRTHLVSHQLGWLHCYEWPFRTQHLKDTLLQLIAGISWPRLIFESKTCKQTLTVDISWSEQTALLPPPSTLHYCNYNSASRQVSSFPRMRDQSAEAAFFQHHIIASGPLFQTTQLDSNHSITENTRPAALECWPHTKLAINIEAATGSRRTYLLKNEFHVIWLVWWQKSNFLRCSFRQKSTDAIPESLHPHVGILCQTS